MSYNFGVDSACPIYTRMILFFSYEYLGLYENMEQGNRGVVLKEEYTYDDELVKVYSMYLYMF